MMMETSRRYLKPKKHCNRHFSLTALLSRMNIFYYYYSITPDRKKGDDRQQATLVIRTTWVADADAT